MVVLSLGAGVQSSTMALMALNGDLDYKVDCAIFAHCLQYMQANGHRMPEKSSCLGCPYHSDRQWLELKHGNPEEWKETVELDMIIRDRASGFKQKQYMHKSCKPLDKVDFSAIEDQIDMFGNECEGMCGP